MDRSKKTGRQRLSTDRVLSFTQALYWQRGASKYKIRR